MVTLQARYWWAYGIRGIAAIIFGIMALAWPQETFYVLTLLFGAFALADGIFAIVGAIRRFERRRPVGWMFFEGVMGALIGFMAFFFTGLTAQALVFLIAAWAIITGVLEIAEALDLRLVIMDELLLILSGIASVIFGVLLFFFPVAGITVVALIVGIYATIFGALEAGLAWVLRGMQHSVATQDATPLQTA